MAFRGSRIEGGFHVTGRLLASATSASPLVLIPVSQVSAAGEFSNKGLTIVFLKWERNTATRLHLIDSASATILTDIRSSVFLDAPGIGSRNGRGISAVIEGSGSSLTMVAIPDHDGQQRLTVP